MPGDAKTANFLYQSSIKWTLPALHCIGVSISRQQWEGRFDRELFCVLSVFLFGPVCHIKRGHQTLRIP